MGSHMRALYDTHEKQIIENKLLKTERIHQLKYLWDFDREVQCAAWNYPTVGAYYRDASSAGSVLNIRIPTLALHAVDDPIAADEGVPYEEIRHNPYVVLCATSGGGHLAWFERGGGRWHRKPVSSKKVFPAVSASLIIATQTMAFLNEMWKKVDFAKLERPKEGRPPHGGFESPFVFNSMRRPLHISESK